MAVYLIHFAKPFSHARHYIGFCETKKNIPLRLEHHKAGRGGSLPHAVAKAGIEMVIARVWEDGDRNYERKLKNQKMAPRLCPICRKEKDAKRHKK